MTMLRDHDRQVDLVRNVCEQPADRLEAAP
jgi:hypothetical protein